MRNKKSNYPRKVEKKIATHRKGTIMKKYLITLKDEFNKFNSYTGTIKIPIGRTFSDNQKELSLGLVEEEDEISAKLKFVAEYIPNINMSKNFRVTKIKSIHMINAYEMSIETNAELTI